MSRRLLELAALRETTVIIDGETLRIREPNGLEMMEYRAKRVTSLPEAIAYLISRCVIEDREHEDSEGKKLTLKDLPVFTLDESRKIANGHAKVFTPLVIALTGFDFDPTEKKSSPSPKNSGIDSPSH